MSISWAGTYIWLRDPIRKASDSRRTLFSKSPKVFPLRTLLVEYFVRVGCWVQNCMRRPFSSRDLLGCMALKVFMAKAGLFWPPLTLVFIVKASGNLFHSQGASWGTKAVVENGENGPTCQPATCQSISPLHTTLQVGEETKHADDKGQWQKQNVFQRKSQILLSILVNSIFSIIFMTAS